MGFKTQNKEKLMQIAAYYGVDLDEDEKLTKDQLIARIEEAGGTWEHYKQMQKLDPQAPTEEGEEPVVEDAGVITTESMKVEAQTNEPQPEPVVEKASAPAAKRLIKMVRQNHSFQRRGYKFTKTHPFALVEESDVNHFLEELSGFRLASPEEAKNYYN